MQLDKSIRSSGAWPVLLMAVLLPAMAFTEGLTLALDVRPEWLGQDGIVMAGSWEPLLFRVRRDGSEGYEPSAAQRAEYEREHSPEMIAALKALGVNFVMMHCYKGGGLEVERESMADAVRFAQRCREAGLRTGVYTYSGAFIWELFFQEMPQARDWVLWDEQGKTRQYGRATYRYYWNRNHPDAQDFYRKILRFAVEDIQVDLIHLDNYAYGPGNDAYSVQRFRNYLRTSFSPEELQAMGVTDIDTVKPPMSGPPDRLLRRVWLDFHAQSLADAYCAMSRYARSLRGDILMECNPGGPGDRIGQRIDHGRLLQGGEAYWDEGRPPGYHGGRLQTRIPTYKIARRMDNMAFAYTTTPLEMAESMAFNLDCLGCICWFEYGRIVKKPGSDEPFSPALVPFIRFFHTRRDLLRGAQVVADVAVLRSYPSQVFADPKYAALTARVEQTLIERPTAFQIIYDVHLDDLARYRVLVLAGCVALSDRQIERIRHYVEAGGHLCVVGPLATHDEWMRERSEALLDTLPPSSAVRIGEDGDLFEAIRQACGGDISLSVDAPPGLCAELTQLPGQYLVHLVNYRTDGAVRASVRAGLPPGRQVQSVTLAGPEQKKDLELPFAQQDETVTFTVAPVPVYEVAIIRMD